MTPEKPSLIVRIPPPIWTLLMLLAAYGLNRAVPALGALELQSLPIALFLGIFGVVLAVWAALLFLATGTEIEPASAANRALVLKGPFRLTRNPMYLGLVLVATGIAFYLGAAIFYAVPAALFALCNAIFIPYEEAKMRRQFGRQYTDYCTRVRRWM